MPAFRVIEQIIPYNFELSLKNKCDLRDNHKISMFYLLIKPGSRQRALVFFGYIWKVSLTFYLKIITIYVK